MPGLTGLDLARKVRGIGTYSSPWDGGEGSVLSPDDNFPDGEFIFCFSIFLTNPVLLYQKKGACSL